MQFTHFSGITYKHDTEFVCSFKFLQMFMSETLFGLDGIGL